MDMFGKVIGGYLIYAIPAMLVLLIIGLISKKRGQKRAEKNDGIDPVQAKKEKEAYEAHQKYLREKELKELSQKILRTEILSQGAGVSVTKGSLGSAMTRAAIGGAIGGTAGAIAGASTGKTTTRNYGTTTFRLYYADGHDKIETVNDGSYIWKKYMELLPKS